MRYLFSFLFLILITGCTTKTPFTQADMQAGKAVIYVYSKYNGYNMTAQYRLHVNEQLVKDELLDKGYLPFNVNPGSVKIDVLGDIVNQHSVTLDVKAGRSYYIQLTPTAETGAFDLLHVSNEIGEKEIQDTVLYSLQQMPEYFSDKNTTKEESAPVRSNSDEIQRLYEMKEKGIITQDEFETLKAKVIN